MMESGMKIGCMEEECYIMQMENQLMMENGRMTNSKVKEYCTMTKCRIQLKTSISEISMKSTTTGSSMKDSSRMMIRMDKESILSLMESTSLDSSKMIWQMDQEHSIRTKEDSLYLSPEYGRTIEWFSDQSYH